MKKIYTFSGLMMLAVSSFAQTGGTYTAVLPGKWHTASGPGIWLGSEPPANCNNCVINLEVVGGGTIMLNTHLTFTGGTTMTIGDGSGDATTLTMPNSGATDTSNANSINLINDNTNSSIKLMPGADSVTVAPNVGHAGDYDGVFTSQVTTGGSGTVVSAVKEVGFSPNLIVNNTIGASGPVANTFLSGGETLSSSGALPILLSNFTATLGETGVDLDWTTALEINSDHFAVERSTDAGANWEVLGTVAAAGNSALPLNYSFVDTKPAQGTDEYRLQMVDKDGVYKYSDVQAIRMGLVTAVSIYPNPARDNVNITLGNASGNTLIRLYNQAGQLLQERNVSNTGGSIVTFAVGNYPEGNYVIVAIGEDGSRQTSKLVITK